MAHTNSIQEKQTKISIQFVAESIRKISRVVQYAMPDSPCNFHENPLIRFFP